MTVLKEGSFLSALPEAICESLKGEIVDRLPRKRLFTEKTSVIRHWIDPNPLHRFQV